MKKQTLSYKTHKARYDAETKVMKALAHPVRLFFVDALAEQAFCVQDLTAMVGLDISTVSKHLSVMKNAGIVTDERSGQNVYYSLKMGCAADFFRCVGDVIEGKECCTPSRKGP